MIDKATCEVLFRKYHDNVYNFCLKYLKNIHAAEDCTQEVFMIMLKKKKEINLSKNLLSWLYETSKRVCKKYLGKNSIQFADIDDYADIIPDTNASAEMSLSDKICDFLGKQDTDLFFEYINADYGERQEIAKRLGIKTTVLYERIKRLREKLSDYLTK